MSGEKEELDGVTGAYISESCESSDGDVKADRRWRMLSHWVWVVRRDDPRAIRTDEQGEEVPALNEELKDGYERRERDQDEELGYLCSRDSRVLKVSWTTDSHSPTAAIMSLRESKD